MNFPFKHCGLAKLGVLIAATIAIPASAGEPDGKKPVHSLRGVVVAKADGRPLAGVTVAMAHKERGWIMIGNRGQLTAYGPTERVLLFFSKRNGRAACTATTDELGRFALANFVSMRDQYTLAAAHSEHGVALLKNVRPDAHVDEPIRIEMDLPSFIELRAPKELEAAGITHSVSLHPAVSSLVDGRAFFGRTAAPFTNVMMNYYVPRTKDGAFHIGPVPAGIDLTLNHSAMTRRTGAPAVLRKTRVRVAPGETLRMSVAWDEGLELNGRVTANDGKPLRDVNVLVTTGSGIDEDAFGTLTDKDGRYRLAGLPPGEHKLDLSRHAVRTGPG
ncbi:MAG: carboxypeptidase-like regulatory domain-containing protein [Phycisphaerae bacterium]